MTLKNEAIGYLFLMLFCVAVNAQMNTAEHLEQCSNFNFSIDVCKDNIDAEGRLNSFCSKTITKCLRVAFLFPRAITAVREIEIDTESTVNFEDVVKTGVSCAKVKKITISIDDRPSSSCVAQPDDQSIPHSFLLSLMSFRTFRVSIDINTNAIPTASYKFNRTCLNQFSNSRTRHSDLKTCIMDKNIGIKMDYYDDDANFQITEIMDNSEQVNSILKKMVDELIHKHNGTLSLLEMKFSQSFPEIPPEFINILYIENLQEKIEKIIWKDNGFQNITAFHFEKPITNLKELDLSENLLRNIEPLFFSKLPNLRKFDLSNNRLASLPLGLNHSKFLKELYIGGNMPFPDSFVLREDDLKMIPQITIFSLRNIPLTESDLRVLSQLAELEKLFLSSCNLQSLPISFLDYFPHLSYLDVSNNKINSFPMSMQIYPNLKYLNLSGNSITSPKLNITPSKFNSLENLNSNCNNFLKCESQSFLILDLSHNDIIPWKDSIFPEFMTLENLNLSHNRISETNKQMLNDFNYVRDLKLDGNVFDCLSCSLSEFQNWIRNKTSDESMKLLTCDYPESLQGQPLLEADGNLEHCLEKVWDYLHNIGIPLAIIILFFGGLIIICFYFRWHVRYFMYIIRWKLKKEEEKEFRLNTKYDAFVSYSGCDQQWILQELIPNMENTDQRYKLCLHERDFLPGEFIMDNIVKSIDQSTKTIFIITNNFVNSQWCKWELQMAQHKLFDDRRRALVLIQLQELDKRIITKTLKHLMKTETYLKWPEEPDGHKLFWLRLKNCIGQPLSLRNVPEGNNNPETEL